jgi:peptide deformylase
MSILHIVKYGSPILAKTAKKIENIDEDIENLAQSMVETMYTAPGIGLAAPQINKGLRLITADLSIGEKKEDLIILINPEVLNIEGSSTLEEGCLSVPGIHEKVTRPFHVTVKGIDLKGKERIIDADDLLARVLLHEIDHLEGKLFIEHLSPLKRNLIKKQLKKQIEQSGI